MAPMKLRINFTPHWHIIDIKELPNGGTEWGCLWLRVVTTPTQHRYFLDSIGLGIDYFRNHLYTAVSFRLIAFSVQIQYKKESKLKLI